MGEQRCSAEFAFAILRTTSQNRNIKLRQVAEEIIIRVTGQPSPAAAVRPSRADRSASGGVPARR